MTVTDAFLQPTALIDIWGDLDEETAVALFPLMTEAEQRIALDRAKEERDSTSREARLLQIAQQNLDWRDGKRLADQLDLERSGALDSWDFIDLDALFDEEQEEPEVGAFDENDLSNGGALFYAGKVNEIHGPSESGKTMVLLAVAAQEIRAGHHVVMVDFEDSGKSIVGRLRWVFGLTREEITERFHYSTPEISFGESARQKIAAVEGVTFCIIDAATESMTLAGLDGRNENEVASWYNEFPKKLARLGIAVVVVDHTPQDNHTRQIGSQHKKSAIDGISYTAEPISPFVKGQRGQLRLKIAKDKPGGVRPHALPQGEGKQYWRGDFVIDGRHSEIPRVELRGIDPHALEIPVNDPGKAREVTSVVLPTPAESQVLLILAEDGGWMGATNICEWFNDGVDPKDPGRMARTAPRKMAVRLIRKGLVERRDAGDSVKYRVTEEGKHSANVWVNEASKDAQTALEIKGSGRVHEPKGEPKGEPE
jgi:hypothetical protein